MAPIGRSQGGRPCFTGIPRTERALRVRHYNIQRVREVGLPHVPGFSHEKVNEAICQMCKNVDRAEEALPQRTGTWWDMLWPRSEYRRALKTSDREMSSVLVRLYSYGVDLDRVGLYADPDLSYYALISSPLGNYLTYQPVAASVEVSARRHTPHPDAFTSPRTEVLSLDEGIGKGSRMPQELPVTEVLEFEKPSSRPAVSNMPAVSAFQPLPIAPVVQSVHPDSRSMIKRLFEEAFSNPIRERRGELEWQMDHGQRAVSVEMTNERNLQVIVTSGWEGGHGKFGMELSREVVGMTNDGRVTRSDPLRKLATLLPPHVKPLFVEQEEPTFGLHLRWVGEEAYRRELSDIFREVPEWKSTVPSSGLIYIDVAKSVGGVHWIHSYDGVIGLFSSPNIHSGREIPVTVLLERFDPDYQMERIWRRLRGEIHVANLHFHSSLLERLGIRATS